MARDPLFLLVTKCSGRKAFTSEQTLSVCWAGSGQLTHAIVLDTSRQTNLGSVVAKRLLYCAQLAGGGLPDEVVADAITLHGDRCGVVIHWKEADEAAALTAAMLTKLRAQLPMAVRSPW